MNQTEWIDVFNSATTFGILTAIAVGIWVLIMKSNYKSRSHKHNK